MTNYEIVENQSMISNEKANYALTKDSMSQEHLAQFFTPAKIANFMATLFILDKNKRKIRILDPGAGEGILSIAILDRIINEKINIDRIEVVAIEIDPKLLVVLESNYKIAFKNCSNVGIDFDYKIIDKDFIEYGFHEKHNSLFTNESEIGLFDFIIANPPYKKIQSSSNFVKNKKNTG